MNLYTPILNVIIYSKCNKIHAFSKYAFRATLSAWLWARLWNDVCKREGLARSRMRETDERVAVDARVLVLTQGQDDSCISDWSYSFIVVITVTSWNVVLSMSLCAQKRDNSRDVLKCDFHVYFQRSSRNASGNEALHTGLI